MTTHNDHTLWQDIYHAPCPNGHAPFSLSTYHLGSLAPFFFIPFSIINNSNTTTCSSYTAKAPNEICHPIIYGDHSGFGTNYRLTFHPVPAYDE
jgi:hypothetical protein